MMRSDSKHANSLRAFQDAGSPTASQHADKAIFNEANRLKLEPIKNYRWVGGRLIIELDVELNSFSFLHILSNTL